MLFKFTKSKRYKLIIKRTLIFLLIFLVLRILIIRGLNFFNYEASNYIEASNNLIEIDDSMDESLYMINNIEINNNKLTLDISMKEDKALSILIDNLQYPHKIYVDDEIISQNIDESINAFDGRYAYKIIEVTENTSISIVGKGLGHTKFFIAENQPMQDYIDIRKFIFVSMLILLFLFTGLSFFFYMKNKNAKYFGVFVIMGVASIIKVIYMGEMFFLAKIIYLPIDDIMLMDQIIRILCGFLPILIMLYIFDIKVNNKVILLFTLYVVSVCLLVAFSSCSDAVIKIAVLIALLPTDIIINYYAFVKSKRFCKPILINNVLFSSFSNYQSLVAFKFLNSGILDFAIDFSFLGLTVYLYGFLIIFIKSILDKVNELKDKEDEYNKMSLLRGISHDIKLPLSIIKSSYEIIDSYDIREDEKKECIRVGNEAVEELECMTENISTYLKIKETNHYRTSIKDTLLKLEKHFDLQNKDNDYEFKVIVDHKDHMIDIDPHQLYRVMYNLVDNAFKYTPKGGNIIVSCLIGKDVRIVIKDTGIGIEKDKVDKIFEPFYRIDDSRNIDGLGIGLSVVKEIIEKADGSIDVESKIGIGSKISIIF